MEVKKYGRSYGAKVGRLWDSPRSHLTCGQLAGAVVVEVVVKNIIFWSCICVISFVIILHAGCGGRNTERFSDALMFRKDSSRLPLLRLRYGL